MSVLTIESDGLEATHVIGQRLGTALTAGSVVALIGPLGSGKTTLVRGVADGAGVDDLRQVNSPTFVLVNEYDTTDRQLRLFHVDAYRLRGSGDLEALGFEEMVTRGAVLVEWADRVADLMPPDTLTCRIEPVGEQQRRFVLSAGGPESQRLLVSLQTAD